MSASAPGPSRLGRWLAIVAIVAVAATLAAAFMRMRTPSEQREVAIDRHRVQDLVRLEQAITDWRVRHDALPADLAEVAAQPGMRLPLNDPESGEPYEYAIRDPDRYALCARFSTDTARTGEDTGYAWIPSPHWAHGTGRQCFERKAEDRGDRKRISGP